MNLNKQTSVRVHIEDDDAVLKLSEQLLHYTQKMIERELVIVCIGTDRSTGDSLGPLVGSILEQSSLHYFHIYGTLQHPVHAVNLEERLTEIKRNHPNAYILAIDACLGRSTNIGTVTIADGPVLPGAAVKKKLPAVGHIHIAGIVNVRGMMEYVVLQNTRLFTVFKMAEIIASVITKTDATLKAVHYTPSPFRPSFRLFNKEKVRSKRA